MPSSTHRVRQSGGSAFGSSYSRSTGRRRPNQGMSGSGPVISKVRERCLYFIGFQTLNNMLPMQYTSLKQRNQFCHNFL